ncbi:MAG: pyridoxal phosphate-dependent aminotransferase [Rhizobiales bacterium]|nr:pyridoxal phosphate-dependent aminotransferase [Hyphomicrobiales bacterium]
MGPDPGSQDLLKSIKASQRNEPDSGILVAVNHGFGRPDIIPLWTGEGHLPTPKFICDAAARSLQDGETFYTWQRGIPELRDALARYHERQFGGPFSAENFFITSSGMQAMQTIFQLLAGEGDEIIVPTPAWPNYPGPMRMMGILPVYVPIRFENRKWHIDLDQLFDSVTDKTKAICLNSPSNPIGWVASVEDLTAVRDFARQRGLWIIADEVYSRFYYPESGGPGRSPSFLDICDHEERVIYANTFSKNWAMTGWRVGWVQAPVALGAAIERIIQYNTSGTPAFLQRACITALEDGEDFVADQVTRARSNRDMVCNTLRQFPEVQFEVPGGAFYQFFALEGMQDSTSTVLRLIDEARIGLAPGGTFGEGGEGFLRMCYLRDPDILSTALERLGNWLGSAKPD